MSVSLPIGLGDPGTRDRTYAGYSEGVSKSVGGEGGGRGASRCTFLRPSWVNGQGRKQVCFSSSGRGGLAP